MILAEQVWDTLSVIDRLELLHCACARAHRNLGLLTFEATLDWDKLLPSTQKDLLNVDWSIVLGRDVTP